MPNLWNPTAPTPLPTLTGSPYAKGFARLYANMGAQGGLWTPSGPSFAAPSQAPGTPGTTQPKTKPPTTPPGSTAPPKTTPPPAANTVAAAPAAPAPQQQGRTFQPLHIPGSEFKGEGIRVFPFDPNPDAQVPMTFQTGNIYIDEGIQRYWQAMPTAWQAWMAKWDPGYRNAYLFYAATGNDTMAEKMKQQYIQFHAAQVKNEQANMQPAPPLPYNPQPGFIR